MQAAASALEENTTLIAQSFKTTLVGKSEKLPLESAIR
jgi:hypothetical protein